MATFKLLAPDGTEYQLDTQGGVSANSRRIGSWNTNVRNEIVLTRDGGGPLSFPVQWRFNDDNHLTLHDDGNELLNFGDDLPVYRLVNNVIEVQPGDAVSFRLRLHPQWGLDKENNLMATISGEESVIEGYVDDSSGRFIFWFEDKTGAKTTEDMFAFSGAWEKDNSAKTEIKLVFKGKVEGGKLFTFALKKAETFVDSAHNHLVLQYNTSAGIKRVELRGSVRISENLGVTFTIAEQKGLEGGVLVAQREIRVATTFAFDRMSGTLELYVGQKRTPKSQRLTLGGQFQARLGATGVELTFLYEQERLLGQAPVPATVSLAVGGVFTFEHGKLMFSYERAGKRSKIAVEGSVEYSTWTGTFGISVETNEGKRDVKGFLSFSW